jgi:N-ethylmaleimide reductase
MNAPAMTTHKMSLYEPYAVGGLSLRNRLVMNPMTRSRSNEAGLANALMAEYYSQRASAGLIITEGTAPSADGRGYANTPGLWNRAQTDSWRQVTQAVHAKGGRIFAQLMHTGRIAHVSNLPRGAEVVAPSAIQAPGKMNAGPLGRQDHSMPRAMDGADVLAAQAAFVQAAVNAIAAGFDGVELHAANGYLMEQFLSPHTNQRTDVWGGSVENRIRFVVETAREAVAAVGKGKVGIRFSPYGALGGMLPYPEVEETYNSLAARLDEAGLAYLHIADHSSMGAPPVPLSLKQSMRKAFGGTFLVGGSFDSRSAQQALDSGLVDLIGVGRGFLANPDLVERWQQELPLNVPDSETFYTPGAKGYTDYPLAS